MSDPDRTATVQSLAARVCAGDVRAIARAISFIEDESPQAADLVRSLFAETGRAYLLGITGPPGAGKTHLLSGAAAEARSQGVDTLFVAAPELDGGGGWTHIPARLAIDDVHVLSPAGQAALFTLLNRAVQGELRLLRAVEE